MNYTNLFCSREVSHQQEIEFLIVFQPYILQTDGKRFFNLIFQKTVQGGPKNVTIFSFLITGAHVFQCVRNFAYLK